MTSDLDELHPDWQVWDHEPGDRLILAYRPDVFDGSQFPPACMPTLYVREGEQDLRLAGPDPVPGTEGSWQVTLFLEPEVSTTFGVCDSWSAAVNLAVERSDAFATGAVDVDAIYQVPRERYLTKLKEMTGVTT